MDRYKKTALKFDKNLGYGRNLRAAEINSSRALLRDSRFSMQRCLEPEEKPKPQSRIPAFGKPMLKAPLNREQMLQKWKAEKEMKKQLELQNKKPTFRIGASVPKSVPSPFNKTKADSTFLSKKNSQKISFNVTHFSKGKENCLKPPSVATKFQASNITNKKTPQSKESHIQMVNSKPHIANKSNSSVKKESQIRTVNSKPTIAHFSNSNAKKESQVKTFNSNLKPPTTNLSNTNVKKELQGKSIHSRPPVTNLSNSIGKKESQIRTVNSKTPATNSSHSSVQKIKPLTESKALKKPEQAQPSLLGRIPNRVPESKIKPVTQQDSGRLKVPSKLAAPIRSGIPNKSGLKPKQEIKPNKKEEPSDTNMTFSCNISTIDPVEEKSFAPKDFTFNLGAELSFSYLEEGPIALYNKLKAGEERTSTPKRKEIIEIQRQEAENAKENPEEKCSEIIEIQKEQTKNTTQTEEKCSEVGRELNPPQVTQNAFAEVSPQPNTTCSEDDSKYTEAVTKILIEDNESTSASKESVAVGSSAENSKVDCPVTENSFEDSHAGNNKKELSVIEESRNSSIAKPLEENYDDFNTNPAVTKQDALEIKENICSAPLDSKTNISSQNFANRESAKMNLEEKFISDATTTFIANENSLVPSYEEKENLPENVFQTGKKVDKSESNTSFSGMLDSEKSYTSLDNLKEPVKLKLHKHKASEETEAPAMSGTSSNSINQFKVPVLEGDAGIVAKRRLSSRVSNMSLRGSRRSEMPQLESISESIESSSPCKTPPKPPKTPKTRKSTISKDFTPRRSLRLARNSVLETTENLFDVRVSLCRNSPDLPGNSSAWDASQITYDFDKLDLEQATEPPPTPQRRTSTRTNKKVSLLYTPPQKGRVSTLRKSIRGDLMSFSPDMSPK